MVCSKCGKAGHNKATCPSRSSSPQSIICKGAPKHETKPRVNMCGLRANSYIAIAIACGATTHILIIDFVLLKAFLDTTKYIFKSIRELLSSRCSTDFFTVNEEWSLTDNGVAHLHTLVNSLPPCMQDTWNYVPCIDERDCVNYDERPFYWNCVDVKYHDQLKYNMVRHMLSYGNNAYVDFKEVIAFKASKVTASTFFVPGDGWCHMCYVTEDNPDKKVELWALPGTPSDMKMVVNVELQLRGLLQRTHQTVDFPGASLVQPTSCSAPAMLEPIIESLEVRECLEFGNVFG